MQKESASGAAARAVAIASVLVIMASTLWRAFGGPDLLFAVLIGATVALVASQYQAIPARLRVTSLTLLGLSLVLIPFARSPVVAIQRGIFISGLLLALMGSVMLLGRCAMRSRGVHLIGTVLRSQKTDRRYGAFTFAGQLFSAMLGMAGANIVFVMAAPPGEKIGERKTSAVAAVTRGFTAASFWSPMFGNMAILLALYPTLNWIEVFPVGLLLAQLTVVVGVLIHRFTRTPVEENRSSSEPPAGFAGAAIPLLGAMLFFLALVLVTGSLLGISTTATIVLLGPGTAVVLNIAMAHRGRRLSEGMRRVREDLRLYPNLASEGLLFIAAGCAGSILGDAFPATWVMRVGDAVSGTALFGIGFLMIAIVGAAIAGIHPVLSAVFLATTLTPDVLGLPPLLHISAILTGWGLSASVTPYSVLSLTASRYAGIGLYQVSMGRNASFALVNGLVACAFLTLAAAILQ